ncbi:MAG: hypothetical protein KBS68_04285 [Clostridiales bacterium]|nr:hypothetical protein [Candidatus Crickella merdequi]
MIGERDNSTKYVVLLIVATLFTATSGVWIRLSEIGPVGTAMWRALLGIPILAYTFCLQVVGLNLVGHCSGHLSVNLASIITLMQPCFAGLYVFFLFGEALGPMEIFGMAIVIIGVYITKREYQK